MADGLYHVTARGWERQVIVDSDRDREDWLRLLDRLAARCNWRVFFWVLMSNHYHLFLRTRGAELVCSIVGIDALGRCFRAAKSDSGRESESRLRVEPVRASQSRAAQDGSLPEQYRWSSYSAYRFARDAADAPAWLDWKPCYGSIPRRTVYLIRRLTDEKVTTLAKRFGGVSVAAISRLLSCAELRRQEDPHWKNLLEELESKCHSNLRNSMKS